AHLHVLGDLQIALQTRPLDDGLVHVGVLQRDRGQAGDGEEQLEVVLGELLEAVLRVELDDAVGDGVGRPDQRHAHDRADAGVGASSTCLLVWLSVAWMVEESSSSAFCHSPSSGGFSKKASTLSQILISSRSFSGVRASTSWLLTKVLLRLLLSSM